MHLKSIDTSGKKSADFRSCFSQIYCSATYVDYLCLSVFGYLDGYDLLLSIPPNSHVLHSCPQSVEMLFSGAVDRPSGQIQ